MRNLPMLVLAKSIKRLRKIDAWMCRGDQWPCKNFFTILTFAMTAVAIALIFKVISFQVQFSGHIHEEKDWNKVPAALRTTEKAVTNYDAAHAALIGYLVAASGGTYDDLSKVVVDAFETGNTRALSDWINARSRIPTNAAPK